MTEGPAKADPVKHASLYDALVAFQGEMPPVVKSADNSHFRSKYCDLSVMGQLRPILGKHGLCYTQNFVITEHGLVFRTSVHGYGESISSDLPINVDANVQKFGSTVTYLRRYALFALLGITPEGEDDDGNEAAAPDVSRGTSPIVPPVRQLQPRGTPKVLREDDL